MKDIHGHELINLIDKQKKGLSIEEIKQLAHREIGKDVIYYTCSRNNMATDGMIAFLLDSRKLIPAENGYVINHGNLCEH